MKVEKHYDSGLVGADASGLDHEMRQELEAAQETSVLGGLGHLGTIPIIPEEVNQQFPRIEGEES